MMANIHPSRLADALAAYRRHKAEGQAAGWWRDDMATDIAESETNILEVLDAHLESVLRDKAWINELDGRRAIMEKRIETDRKAIQVIMDEIGETVRRPLATVSLAKAPRSIEMQDQQLLPPVYWRRVIDKELLLRDLKEGKEVPGATLDNGGPPRLSIRSK